MASSTALRNDVTRVVQTSFSGGIMSPDMYGRTDDTKFNTGLKECENFICLPTGPVENRPGFEYVRETKSQDKPVRLIPFSFSSDQTLVLEFGDKYVRFHSNGQTLMNGSNPYEITSPYRAEDIFGIRYAQKDDVVTLVHGSYPPYELKRYSNLDWRFETINFDNALSAPTGVTATKATTAENEVNADAYTFTYVVTALDSNRKRESVKSAEASCIANIYNNGTTIKIAWSAVSGALYYRIYRSVGGIFSYIGETTSLSIVDDNIAPDSSITPPIYDDVFQRTNGISAVTVTAGGSGYSDIVNGIADGNITTQSSTYEEWTVTVVDSRGNGAVVEPVQSSYSEEKYHDSGTDSDFGSYYYTETTYTLMGYKVTSRGSGYLNPTLRFKSGIKTYEFKPGTTTLLPEVVITDSTGSGAKCRAVVTNGALAAVVIENSGRNYTSPTVTIKASTGSGATATATVSNSKEYPNAVTYYEQRRVFANTGSEPQRIVMTRTGTESDLTYSIPSKDDDRISFEFASQERNAVEHLVSLSRLIVFAESSEWVVTAQNSDAITPSSVSAKAQSYVGSSSVRPVIVSNRVVYGAKRGGHVRAFAYDYNSNGFVTGDLSLRSSGLFDSYSIVDMCTTKAPIPIVWCVNDQGVLLGLTYIPDQNVTAWHKHTTAKGMFESCCAVYEENEDALYVVVRRELESGTARFIERMHMRHFLSLPEAFFVDCGVTVKGDSMTTISGLTWLEGETVSVLADGAELPQMVVEDGKISLPAPANTVSVGLPIEAKIELLPLHSGASTSLMGQKKNVNKVTLRVRDSSGIFVGPDEDRLVEFKQRTTENPGNPPEPVTGDIQMILKPKWDFNATLSIVQKSPLPLTLVALAADVSHSG